jgi:PKD repeat protein
VGTSTERDPVYTYSAAGDYLVQLDATSIWGSDACTDTVSVCEPVDGADFSWLPATPLVQETVTFTATVPMTGTAPFTYDWSFDDGGMASGITTTYVYTATGAYTVTLTVENDCSVEPVWHQLDVRPIRIFLPLVLGG